MLKHLRLLHRENASETIKRYAKGFQSRAIVCVHSVETLELGFPHERKTFYRIENGKAKPVGRDAYYCPWCNDVRLRSGTTCCRSINGGLATYCVLCGCASWPLWMSDAAAPEFTALSPYAIDGRGRPGRSLIMFYVGAYINDPRVPLCTEETA